MLKSQVRLVVIAGIATLVVLMVAVTLAYREYTVLRQEAKISVRLSEGLNDLQYLTMEYMAAPTPRILKQWDSRHQRLSALLDQVSVQDDDVKRIMPEIRTRLASLEGSFERLVRVGTQGLAPDRQEAAERAIVTRLLNQVLALSTLRSRMAEIYFEREDELHARLPLVLGAIFVVGVVMTLILYFRLLRSLSVNLTRLSDAILRMGSGKIDEPIDISVRGDFQPTMQALEQSRERLSRAVKDVEKERVELDHLVYVTSHDLKAPLRSIDNLASWVEEDSAMGLTEDSKDHLSKLRRRVQNLDSLLDDLLTYSRAGRVKITPETVDVAVLAREVVAEIVPGERFRVEFADSLPVILSPRQPLAQVFRHLIANAVQHHDRDEGRIRIEGEEDDAGVGYKFRISDDGPGIPTGFQKRVFEMFQTLKPRDEAESSGMGLPIARRLVQSYNGEINIVSAGGRGCTVEFTWFPERRTQTESAARDPFAN